MKILYKRIYDIPLQKFKNKIFYKRIFYKKWGNKVYLTLYQLKTELNQ